MKIGIDGSGKQEVKIESHHIYVLDSYPSHTMSVIQFSDFTSEFIITMYRHLQRSRAVEIRRIKYVSVTETCMHPLPDGSPMMHLEGTRVFACPLGTFECCACSQTASITLEQPYGDERDHVAGGFLCKECVSTLNIDAHHLVMPSHMLMQPVDDAMSYLPRAQSLTTLRSLQRDLAAYHTEGEVSLSDDLKHQIRCIAASDIQAVAKGWLVRQRAKREVREMKAYHRGVQLMLLALKQQSQSYDSDSMFRVVSMGWPPLQFARFPFPSLVAPTPAPPPLPHPAATAATAAPAPAEAAVIQAAS